MYLPQHGGLQKKLRKERRVLLQAICDLLNIQPFNRYNGENTLESHPKCGVITSCSVKDVHVGEQPADSSFPTPNADGISADWYQAQSSNKKRQ